MNTKNLLFLGAGYLTGRYAKRTQSILGVDRGVFGVGQAKSINEVIEIIMSAPKSERSNLFRQIPMRFTRSREYFALRNKIARDK